ncbi:MAG: hypothetical protein J6Z31_09275 [Fibrobacter sp.]|nr:hypothetical protein [Fibrobacter sp.]
MKRFIFAALPILSAGIFFACSTYVSGGTSEETNTIAGVVTLPSGDVAARVAVEAQAVSGTDSTIYRDTTNSKGEFSISPKANGVYGLSGISKDYAFYDTISVYGKSVSRNAELVQTETISGNVFLRTNEAAQGAVVSIAGSPWKAVVDEDGSFTLFDVPQGEHSIQVLSPKTNYVLSQNYTVHVAESSDSSTVKSIAEPWILPLSPDYAMAGYWTFESLIEKVAPDVRGVSGNAKLYGDASLEAGRDASKAIHFESASDFAVVENDKGVLDSAKAFTVEAWVNIQSLQSDSSFVKNIFGKLGFSDSAVFSLSVLQDTCGIEGSAFGFFMAQGSGDSLRCESAVIGRSHVELERWNYVAASWSGDTAKLYVNGKFEASVATNFTELVGENGIPLYFGKENLKMSIDEVRLSTTAIEASDALYRYQE